MLIPRRLVHGALDVFPDGLPFNGTDFGFGFGISSLPFTANYIADLNGCDETIIETPVDSGILYRRTNCTNGADVELVVLPESGHVPYAGSTEVIPGVANTTVDTTAWAWDFCSTKVKSKIPEVFMTANGEAPAEAPSVSPTSGVSSIKVVKLLTCSMSLAVVVFAM